MLVSVYTSKGGRRRMKRRPKRRRMCDSHNGAWGKFAAAGENGVGDVLSSEIWILGAFEIVREIEDP
jgi:hypothetical protein